MVPRVICQLVLFMSATLLAFGSTGAEEVDPQRLQDLISADVAQHGSVMVKFYAPWCGHCKSLEPKYDFVAERFKGTDVRIAKIDADKYRDKLQSFEINGFPTLIFFSVSDHVVSGSSTLRSSEVYRGSREVKQLISFLNRRCGTSVSFEGYKNTRKPSSRQSADPAMKMLYSSFDLLNQLQYKEANELLSETASGEGRSASSAQRVQAKQKAIGGTIRSFSVDRWMQGTIVRGNPPSLKQDDVVSLIARLDFRSASRGQLEPLLLDAHALGSKVQVIRLTGTVWDMSEEDVPYPVAIAPSDGQPNVVVVSENGRSIETLLKDMQSAIVVVNERVVWAAHVGMINDKLIASIKDLANGKAWESFDQVGCGSAGASEKADDDVCSSPAASSSGSNKDEL